MDIGDKLKEAREAKGLTLEAVEEETKIRRKYIRALEEEQFHVLPGSIYAKAFLKNYAKFLGLNVYEIMEAYNRLVAETVNEAPDESTKDPEDEIKVSVPGKRRYWLYLAIVLVIIGLAFSVYFGAAGLLSKSPVEKETGEPTGTPRQANGQAQTPPGQIQTAEQETPPAIFGVNLVLNVKDSRCWMRVVVDGSHVFEGEVSAGQSKTFDAEEKITVTLGDAGTVEVTLNGQNLGSLGSRGAVVTREFTAQPGG